MIWQFLKALLMLLLVYVLFLGICSALVRPNKLYTQHSDFYRFLLTSATAAAIWLLRIKVHVSGEEKLPQGVPILFVSNHRSNYDPPLTWQVFQKWKIAFISKPENFRIPIFGRIIRRCCFMPIDRQNPRKALVAVRNAAKLLAAGQVSVGVYPEGTRSKSCELLPFHSVVFKVAQQAGAPIAVVTVTGTENICKRTPFRKTDVYIDVAELIPAEQVAAQRTEQLGEHIRQCMLQSIEMREGGAVLPQSTC